MSDLLDRSKENEIASDILAELEYEGYSTEESIPGLVAAIISLADGDGDVLMEASDLLATA